MLGIAIKCSDVSNPCRSVSVCKAWADRVTNEFYLQGDEERLRGLPISAFMDRTKPGLARCQKTFCEIVVGPLYEAWSKVLASTAVCLANLEQNVVEWKRIEGEEVVL
eukprot:TRINITY_DN4766_c0_g1_i6.p1 TRINITY_DN4766_c0_g1~~TRINITY_DN4766_c0_g1_i6.p1  ORF type:complete len:108 (+),score=24.07 TRINITY_DN4766_c0_g1_i6:86-409(+)